ncbi:cyclase family protein [Marinitenerispora sediminis]|uniref:Cyclase n=1 Tax=Marinitenerispora sediminis TaxID=1931232 RepID=A0A368T7Y2_9ACTN|nr:cyclase family protein [Marinitenerispora sediminis]RCV51042.1 cyclase [Marinitenerispora sediminis]RCV57035.1 cyclase [Marinitenerispora sediminis]RCV60001.1 cyclase [Marinitenerispora sediminis]
MRVSRIVDLSHPLGRTTQVYPGDPVPVLTTVATVERDGYHVTHVSMSSQSGTHADAPYHFFSDGTRIDRLDLRLFTGPAVVVDVTGRPARSAIGTDDLAPYRSLLRPGTIVLLHTGWSVYHGTDHYFAHPYLSGAAAAELVAVGIRTIGIDAPSPDRTPAAGETAGDWPVHRRVLGAGGTLIENLCRLAEIDFPDPLFSAAPIALEGADGAPVRAMALRVG